MARHPHAEGGDGAAPAATLSGMDPVGMLIWGGGLMGLGLLLGLARRWLSASVVIALLAGLACLVIGVLGGDEVSVRWAALPVAAASLVLAVALLDWVRGARG